METFGYHLIIMMLGIDSLIDLSIEGISNILHLSDDKVIAKVECISGTKRLDQSDVSVIQAFMEGEEDRPLKMLVKNVDVLDQMARIKKTQEKWRISIQSFENEYNYFQRNESEKV